MLAGSVPPVILAEAQKWLAANRETAQAQWKEHNPTLRRWHDDEGHCC
ncbi:hypothetical protein [Steroidobacter denitrificans]